MVNKTTTKPQILAHFLFLVAKTNETTLKANIINWRIVVSSEVVDEELELSVTTVEKTISVTNKANNGINIKLSFYQI